jgi:hypothetical protein
MTRVVKKRAFNAGERNGKAKVDEEAARRIIAVCAYDPAVGYAPGSVAQMAEEYGVTRKTICSIASRKSWRHVQ